VWSDDNAYDDEGGRNSGSGAALCNLNLHWNLLLEISITIRSAIPMLTLYIAFLLELFDDLEHVDPPLILLRSNLIVPPPSCVGIIGVGVNSAAVNRP